MNQTQTLIRALLRGPLTYGEMMRVSGSLSPQKRVREGLQGRPDLMLDKTGRKWSHGKRLVTWRLRKVAP